MHGSLDGEDDLTLEIQVPISPPVPAQISEGLPRSLGHWGVAEIRLRFKRFIWIEELIEMVEKVTSHNLCWPEKSPNPSRDNYLSVEKLAKAIGSKLEGNQDIRWFAITVENLSEGFSTFASLEGPESFTGTPPGVSQSRLPARDQSDSHRFTIVRRPAGVYALQGAHLGHL